MGASYHRVCTGCRRLLPARRFRGRIQRGGGRVDGGRPEGEEQHQGEDGDHRERQGGAHVRRGKLEYMGRKCPPKKRPRGAAGAGPAPGGEADEQPAAAHEADDDEPGPALEAVALSAGGSTPLDLVARPGELTLWPGDDGRGTAELALALSGRFRPVTGTVRLLGRETTSALLRRQVVPARVEEAIAAEPRLTVGEYLASCAVLHGSRHNRLDGPQALADVDYQGGAHVPIDELGPADAVRVAVAGALLARPVAVIVDRVDRGVGADDWPGLVADLHRAAELSGVALIASIIRAMEVDR